MEKNNLKHLFQKIYGNEIKSKKEKFKIILQDFKISPDESVLITDTLGDVLDADILHISSIVVLWGYQLKKHFDSVNKKVVFVKNPVELTKAITTHFSG